MKYIVSSILLFLVLFGLCLASAAYVSNAVQETEALLADAMTLQQHGHAREAAAVTHSAADRWNSHQTYFGTVLRHDEVDDVIREFSRLESYADTEDREEFLGNCAALLATLKHIREMEWPYIYNLL